MFIHPTLQQMLYTGRLRALYFAVLPLYLLATLSQGQVAPTASLVGAVTDSTGAAIPNASVTLRNPATQLTRQTHTVSDGQYRFTLVPVGNYRLEVSTPGLAPY